MSYGQIAKLVKRPLSARAVGWAMHQCPDDVPWHRVVNALGGMSTDELADVPKGLQQYLLESEGVEFRASGTLPMARYRWVPEARPGTARKRSSTGRTRTRARKK
jgi:methylated-DNA-protein-cysteine methyltransferase-like protein